MRPNGHRGPSGRRREGTGEAGMREGYERVGSGGWLEFVLISGVWGHMSIVIRPLATCVCVLERTAAEPRSA